MKKWWGVLVGGLAAALAGVVWLLLYVAGQKKKAQAMSEASKASKTAADAAYVEADKKLHDEQLRGLQEKSDTLKTAIADVEKERTTKSPEEMTADEVAKGFRVGGL